MSTSCISRAPPPCGLVDSTHHYQYNQIIKIYKDWGNHYLEKARFKKTIQDLQTDLSDGVLLADLIEAVCFQKVPDIHRKPKSQVAMVENLDRCLVFLLRLGVPLDGISAKDIRQHNIKSVLGVFFALSKYKQMQKMTESSCSSAPPSKLQKPRQNVHNHAADDINKHALSKLPQTTHNQQQHSTNIPTVSHRSSRNLLSGLKTSNSAQSSRSASPSHSFIPTPRTSVTSSSARSSLNEKQLYGNKNMYVNGNDGHNSNTIASPYSASSATKSVHFEKMKYSGSKEKSSKIGMCNGNSSNSKRPSSSSGVSSARSSDSSAASFSNESSKSTHKVQQPNGDKEMKSSLKKKVTVKPSDASKSIKFSNKSCSPSQYKNGPDEKYDGGTGTSSMTSSSTSTTLTGMSEKVEAISPSVNNVMVEPFRNSGSGIPKPMAAVKGTVIKPPNVVEKMEEIKQSAETKPVEEENHDPKVQITKSQKEDKGNRVTFDITNDTPPKTNADDEGENDSLVILPMEPLTSRAYKRGIVSPNCVINSPSTLDFAGRMYDIKRAHGPSNVFTNYSDRSQFPNTTCGYLSDGEVLRHTQYNGSEDGLVAEVDTGYMSEGGAQFYAQFSRNNRKKLDGSSVSLSQNEVHGCKLKPPDYNSAVSSTINLQHPSVEDYNKQNMSRNHRGFEDGHPASPPEPAPTQPSAVYRIMSGHSLPPSSPQRSATPSDLPSNVVYRVLGSRNHVKKSDSSQQTDNSLGKSSSSSSNAAQWKKYTDIGASRSASLESHHRSSPETSHRKSEKKRTGSTSSSRDELDDGDYYGIDRKSRSDKNKSRGGVGVPSSFGYVKRSTNSAIKESRTAQVSAVPRTKIKVSGGTQTDMRCYSTMPNNGSQLPQNIRDRMLVMTPTPPSPLRQTRCKQSTPDSTAYPEHRSVISSPYAVYADSTPYSASLPNRSHPLGSLCEAESIESLPAQIFRNQSNRSSFTSPGKIMPASPSSNRLSRSNSIRSTKSEKMYPSMYGREADDTNPFYNNQANAGSYRRSSVITEPPSPTPSNMSQATSESSRYTYGGASASTGNYYGSSGSPHHSNTIYNGKMRALDENGISEMYQPSGTYHDGTMAEDQGSVMSLTSTSSSVHAIHDDKNMTEVRRLKKHLADAQEKVATLTAQLSANARVVSTFEKSLSNMTQKLQQLTLSAENKDAELAELRATIQKLSTNNGSRSNGASSNQPAVCPSPSLARRYTINNNASSIDSNNVSGGVAENISRQHSADSVSSLVSLSSACSLSSGNHRGSDNSVGQICDRNKKKRGWLRSSFSKAFSRSKKNRNGSVSDTEDFRTSNFDMSPPASPLFRLSNHHNGNLPPSGFTSSPLHTINDDDCVNQPLYEDEDGDGDEKELEPELEEDVVKQLKKQLREKDLALTEIRLEALSSTAQLESLKETICKMRSDMISLKMDNERLQRIVCDKSFTASENSLTGALESTITGECDETATKRVLVVVCGGSHGSYQKYAESRSCNVISRVAVSQKTSWTQLDNIIYNTFEEYVERLDEDGLGLVRDSVWSYHVGEVVRFRDSEDAEMTPHHYLSSEPISICLRGATQNASLDALAFDTLIPKQTLQSYLTLIAERGNVVLFGPVGIGKSFLANKLAQFLVYKVGKEPNATTIVTLNVIDKSVKETKQQLRALLEHAKSNAPESPVVAIVENLPTLRWMEEIVELEDASAIQLICTTCQVDSGAQRMPNVGFIGCSNTVQPWKGLLRRYLKRKLCEAECRGGARNHELRSIIDWIPTVQQRINDFLERNSSDITIGAQLLMNCPMDVSGSQIWFVDQWNYKLIPYLANAMKHSKLNECQDPTDSIICDYPWSNIHQLRADKPALNRITPEDIDTEKKSSSDPLFFMLRTLQEAANSSSNNKSND